MGRGGTPRASNSGDGRKDSTAAVGAAFSGASISRAEVEVGGLGSKAPSGAEFAAVGIRVELADATSTGAAGDVGISTGGAANFGNSVVLEVGAGMGAAFMADEGAALGVGVGAGSLVILSVGVAREEGIVSGRGAGFGVEGARVDAIKGVGVGVGKLFPVDMGTTEGARTAFGVGIARTATSAGDTVRGAADVGAVAGSSSLDRRDSASNRLSAAAVAGRSSDEGATFGAA